jgi:hypothetical protein
MSALGQSGQAVPCQNAPLSAWSNSGQKRVRSDCPLSAQSGHRPLPQRDDQSVEVGGNNQPDLAARQSQHRAVLVG